MAKYRKKPVVIEAEVYKEGLEDGFDLFQIHPNMRGLTKKPYIQTLEGKMAIDEGDYIITGIKNERYPCKPDIFKETYEKVEEENLEEEVEMDEDYEVIECSECWEEKAVEKGTWALSEGMCEQCYCEYQGG